MKHREKHPWLDVGDCFGCKIASVKVGTSEIRREREGTGPDGGLGTKEYVRRMYAERRARGEPDPIPENSKAARYAPATGKYI